MSVYVAAESLLRRDRTVLLLAAACLVGLSWLLLAAPAPHSHAAGTRGFVLSFSMWFVMMVAMMLPPVMPWILLHSRLQCSRETLAAPLGRALIFAAGYFAVWGLYSLTATVVQQELLGLALLDRVELSVGPRVGGTAVVNLAFHRCRGGSPRVVRVVDKLFDLSILQFLLRSRVRTAGTPCGTYRAGRERPGWGSGFSLPGAAAAPTERIHTGVSTRETRRQK